MITPSQRVRQKMNILWGINSILTDYFDDFDDALNIISDLMLKNNIGNPGEQVVVVAGTPFGIVGTTNTIRVLRLHNDRKSS